MSSIEYGPHIAHVIQDAIRADPDAAIDPKHIDNMRGRMVGLGCSAVDIVEEALELNDNIKPTEMLVMLERDENYEPPDMKAIDTKALVEDYSKEEGPRLTPMTILGDFCAKFSEHPKRQFIVEHLMLRKYLTAMVSPGGVGKSVFNLTMAISIAIGRDLLGLGVNEQTGVLIINNEEESEELERRIMGILQHYNIDPAELAGNFFYESGYGNPFVVAEVIGNTVIQTPVVEEVVGFIRENDVGAVFVDPFISTHTVEENDNSRIEGVVSIYRHIAAETSCAIAMAHHVKKGGDNSEAHAGSADAARGASSLMSAVRIGCTLAKMSKETADKIGLDDTERSRMIRLDGGKSNYSLPDGEATWFRMHSVLLPNGDYVGVPEPRNLKVEFDSHTKSGESKKWHAVSVAEALERVIGGQAEAAWASLRAKFKADNDIGDSAANSHVTLLSMSQESPDRIRTNSGMYVEYWATKDRPTAPIIIHRREIGE